MRRKARDIQVERLEYVAATRGIHTNGQCSCDERTLRRALSYYRRRCEFLQVTIQEMRDGRPEERIREMAEFVIRESPPPVSR